MRLSLGFSAFFLNRTNRSGIIKDAGVIGGLAQKGSYLIDCRFNRAELARRILRISKYKDRIHLSKLDALDFLKRCDRDLPHSSFLFIDPPYFVKGSSLYTNFYKPKDHAFVAKRIIESSHRWLVTYDDAPEIRKLYRNRRQYSFDINYSLHEKRVGTELLIASSRLKMPDEVKSRQIN
jgi:DNA adenine methylase